MQSSIVSEPEAFSMACLIYQGLTVPGPRQIPCEHESSLSPLGIYRLRDAQAMPILEMKLRQLQATVSRLQSNRRVAPV
ncbi:MAG: hypothetical protein CMN94_02685 [Synechococcus sp. EAC657]|nr:hypothetical protein [Synechococcus sp. EAC657]